MNKAYSTKTYLLGMSLLAAVAGLAISTTFSFTLIKDSFHKPVFVPEICNNGMDDDGDGLIDAADPDCNYVIKDLYLSDPGQSLDRVDPVATGDATTAFSGILSVTPSSPTTVDLIAVKDAYIMKKSDANNFGSCTSLIVDRESTDLQRALLAFDLSSIPANASISSAELRLNCTSSGGALSLAVYQIDATDLWDEGTSCNTSGAVNWTQRTSSSNWGSTGVIGDPGTATSVASIANPGTGIHSWNITPLVQSWHNGSSVNNGVMVGSPDGGGDRKVTYNSRESTGTKPALRITYTIPLSSSVTFTQTPAMCSPLQLPTGGTISVSTFISSPGTIGTVTKSVIASSDDAEEEGPGGASLGIGGMYLNSTDVELTADMEPAASGTQKIGLRFTGLGIPSGAIITNAYLTFGAIAADSPNTNNGATNLTIKAEAAGNPGTFTSTVNNITNRPTTAASVSWSPGSWTSGTSYNSPNISSIVQEVVNLSGWASGNSMVFIITGTGSRSADSYDGNPANAPKLTVEYSLGGSSFPANPNVTATLKHGTTTFATLTNPSYDSSTGLLTWTGTLPSAVTIPAGAAISLSITTGEPAPFFIEYDSQIKPSKISLPVTTYIDITSYAVYDAAYPGGSVITNATGGTTVYPRAVVTDPFGFDDITGLNITISPPGTTVAATSVATSGCTRTYQYTWTTPFSSGTYTIPATAKEGYENTVTRVKNLNFDLCSPTVGTPVFTLGGTSSRCLGAGSVTYSATAANSTSLTYSLDAGSLAAGNTISSVTGAVTYASGWNGTSVITATANGCGGPKTATHTVTVNPAVGTPVFALGPTSTRCQGAYTTTYTATATGATGMTYILDAASLAGGNTINASTGAVTFVAGWASNSIITASAAGCQGPKTATHTVSTSASVTTPVFTMGTSSTRCQGAGSVTYTATALNSSGMTYSLDASSLAAGNTINASTGAVTYVAGWTGTTTVTASAAGCGGPKTATHTVTNTPNGTLTFALGATSTRAYGAGTVTYSATANNGGAITYSLDATSLAAGNTINSSTGAVTYSASWVGTAYINASVNGCAGTKTATHAASTTNVFKQLYLSGPSQALDRVDPVATADTTTATTDILSSVVPTVVMIDATSTGFSENPGSTNFYVPHTTGTGTNRLMLVGISQKNKLVNGVTYGGIPLNLVGEEIDNGNARMHLYSLINPPSGTANVVVQLSANPDKGIVVGVTTFTGVNQTTPLGTFNGTEDKTAFPSIAISSASGELVYSVATIRSTTFSVNSGQTELYNIKTSGEIEGGSASTKPGAASVTMGWTAASEQDWAIGGVSIKPAAAITNTTFTQSPALCSPLTIKSGQPITVTCYVSNVVGNMTGNPNITALLKYGSTNIISMGSPVWNSGAGILTWTGTLGSDVTVPAGQAIALQLTTAQTTVTFKIDYDSQTKPSKVNLPVSTFIDITSHAVYDAAYPGGSVINSAVTGTTVYPRAVVTDPFGFNDITGLDIRITPPGTTVAATSVATAGCTRTYQYTWNTAALGGTYSIPATAKEGFENTVVDVQALSFDICSPTIGTPVFTLGATSTRCRGAGAVVYAATSSNSTGITYSLDAASLSAGNFIDAATGSVTFVETWSGTSTITATATGCGGPKSSSHTVTITPYVGTPVFASGATSIRCQGAGTVTYPATASNTTGITYSLNAAAIAGGNTINATTGAVTYAAGWTGTTIITASAAGCNGPATATHTVTITPSVGTPVFDSGASSGRCGAGVFVYNASAANSTGITYSLDAASIAGGNTINTSTGAVTFAPGWTSASTVTASAAGCNGPATATHTISISSACPPIAEDDAATGAGGAPLPVNVLANDTDINNNINSSSLSIVSQPSNGSAVLSGGNVVYLPNGSYEGVDQFTYRVCDLTAPTPLCDTATVVVTITPNTADACSEAVKQQVYYLPYPEQDAFDCLEASSQSSMLPMPSNNIRTVISIKIPYPGMILIWDHWEDGYEADPQHPTQSTTQIWGDGNPYNGIAPGYITDDLPAGAGIVLDNTMPSNPRNPASIFYDGKDKVVSSGHISITQVLGEPTYLPVQTIKTNVTSVGDFGLSFTIPVGQNFNSRDFQYTALFIRASENNTSINVDKDNNGTFETNFTLNEGQSYLVNGGVLTGATVAANKPIGVEWHAAGVDNFSVRNAPIFPATWYSNIYYTPVPTTQSPDTAVVMLYNNLNRSIEINWYWGPSGSGTINLPAKTVKRFPLGISSNNAYKFVNPTGEAFTAIEIIDSYTPGGGGNNGVTYDWSFNLISEERLTSFASVAWAPGGLNILPPSSPDVNGNPIWVTPSASTTIYVKWDGDLLNGGSVSPCGFRYDDSYTLQALRYQRLKDNNDNDQGGIAVYTCDGTKIAAVYGEDPQGSSTGIGIAYWDVGTTIQPFCGTKLIFANDDRAYTLTDQPVTVPVLKNDIGFLAVIDPPTLSTSGYLQPKNGTVSVNSNGTVLYTPNPGFVGLDTLEYGVCSTPGSPPNVVCDRAYVFITVNSCPSPAQRNLISGTVFSDKNKDGIKNDDGTGFSPAKVYLYVDGNCNGIINSGELVDSVIVDASGTYQFVRYPEKIVADNFDGAGGTTTCANGNDGTAPWSTSWMDAGDASTGYCVSPAQSEGNTDVEIRQDGIFGYALRLDHSNKSATRTLNMSGATYAFLSFSYRKASNNLTAGEDVLVQVSSNGSSFTTVFTISGNGTTNAAYVPVYNLNITSYASATTYLRFLTNANVDEGEHVFIDNISIRYLRYPQCYITRVDPASIPADHYLTTAGQYTMTANNGGSCLAPFDYGVAKNSTTVSGTLFNDPNGLSDGLVNGTPIGMPSGATIYAYLVDATGKVRFKTTVHNANGTYSFSQTDVNSTFTLRLSTANVPLYATAPAAASLPVGWAAAGEAFGTNNLAGTGNEPGTPNLAITVTTATSPVTNVNMGIQQVNAGADRVACRSGSATMAATTTPGTWTPQAGNPGTATITSPNSPTTTITNFSASGTYYFLWTNNGVSDIAAISVYSDPQITAQATGFTECVGGDQSIGVVVTGGVPPLTYQWQSSTDNVTFANIAGANSPGYTPPGTTPGTTYYRAIITPNGGGCGTLTSAVATVVIVADPAITVPPSNLTVCTGAGQALSVTATGGAPPLTYQWQNSTDNVTFSDIAGANADSYIPPSATQGTTYYRVIVGSAGNGCGSVTSGSATVTVNNRPVANLSADTTICSGNSVTMNASASGGTAPYTFNWSNGIGSGASKTVSPSGTTTYVVTVSDANGCTSTANAVITVNASPAANAGADVGICLGSSTTLTASGGVGYNWDNGLGSGASKTVNPSSTTTYTVTVTAANGCTATDQVVVTVNSLPVANAGNDAIICLGATATLNASGGVTYSWDNSLGTGATKTVSPASTTTYTVTVTDANGCTAADQVMVTVNALPLADAGQDTTICNGTFATLTATGGVGYSWNNGLGNGATKTVSPTSTRTYTVTVTGANGCTTTDQVTVNVITCVENCTNGIDDDGEGLADCDDPDCVVDVYAGSDLSSCIGDSVTISITATGSTQPYVYSWSHGLGNGQTKTILTASNATYSITVTGATGCTGTDQVEVTVYPCPEVCTDGLDNDADGLVDCDDPDCAITGAPVLNDDSYGACPGVTFSETVIFNDVNLKNSVFSITANPVSGSVSISSQGKFTYTPNGAVCGLDSFQYQVCNSVSGCCDQAMVTLYIGDNDPPQLLNIPADLTISCGDEIPPPSTVFAVDECPGIYVDLQESTTDYINGVCESYTLTRTWTATDLCGNSTSGSQNIYVIDLTPPEIFQVYTLANGKKLVAGTAKRVTHLWKQVPFPVSFSEPPVILTQVASAEESSTVVVRQKNITVSGFQLRIQEEENTNGLHLPESVNWIAVEPGSVTDVLSSGIWTNANNTLQSFSFPQTFSSIPNLFAAVRTTNETDPVSIRHQAVTISGASIFLQEEMSNDAETIHANESVSYLAVKPGAVLKDNNNRTFGETGTLSLNHAWTTVNLTRKYTKPVVIMSTLSNLDAAPATLRVRSITENSFQVRVEEWNNLDGIHLPENVAYLVVEGSIPASSENFCDGSGTALIDGVNLFVFDNCDDQIQLSYDEDSELGFNGIIITRNWTASDDCGNTALVTRPDTCRIASLRLKTLLYGASLGNVGQSSMRDDLRLLNFLPTSEPYSELGGYQHKGSGGNETILPGMLSLTGDDAIVDWVFIEIRDPGNDKVILATQSALLLRNGSVVAAGGGDVLYFPTLVEGDYYVVVKHRNHLPLMTDQVWYLSSDNPPMIDFTQPSFPVRGGNAAGRLFAGKRAMWSGDLNGDNKIIYQGPLNDVFSLFSRVLADNGNNNYLANYVSTGYDRNDLNLDGKIIYQGPNNERALILYHSTLIHPSNVAFLANYIVKASLP
jgi:hypothetical protein